MTIRVKLVIMIRMPGQGEDRNRTMISSRPEFSRLVRSGGPEELKLFRKSVGCESFG